ncbi:MAG TPA: WD40 repeat domain-containing protein [Acidimicrobiia bacterium]
MGALVVSSLLVAACSSGAQTGDGISTTTGADTGDTSGSSAPTASEGPTPPPGGCPARGDGVPWGDDASVTLEQISDDDGVVVYAAEYPLPGPTEGLWTQWGQGIALGDGRHLSAVGDHLGADANSYFFVYDAADRTLTRFADVLSVVPHEEGAFGYGKIHAQMVQDRCGTVWATTYWGTRDDLVYENGYEGDRLLAIDPGGRTVTDHGPIAGEYGMPTMTITSDGVTLVAGSVDVESGEEDTGVLTVFDTSTSEVVHQVDDPRQFGFRALGIDPVSGGVMYGIGDGELAVLDPSTGEFEDLDITLPGDWLRAITRPAPDGTVYGISDDESFLFSISPNGSLTELGEPGGTTTSIGMTPDGTRVFWMPEAHGGAWEVGANIMSMDTASGEVTEVVSLLDSFEEELGLLPGGTYSTVYDDGRLILGVNASDLDDDSGFGTVVLVVVEGI